MCSAVCSIEDGERTEILFFNGKILPRLKIVVLVLKMKRSSKTRLLCLFLHPSLSYQALMLTYTLQLLDQAMLVHILFRTMVLTLYVCPFPAFLYAE